MIFTSIDDLRTRLEHCKAVNFIFAQSISATVFVFSEQDDLYHGMREELMYTFPLFKEIIMSCDDIIQELKYSSILSVLCKDRGEVKTLDDAEQFIASQCV